jgi:hypothetical protein
MFRRLRLLAVALLSATAVFASAAAAEMPSNRDAPTITAVPAPVVGQPLLGNNGTWLYVDGSACRDECRYSFAWQRCIPGSRCEAIAGAFQRAYRVGSEDVGRSLRVAVTATKLDCNAINQDCREISRTALSAPTPPVATPAPPPLRLAIAGLTVSPRAGGRLLISVRITDGNGRAVRGGRVIVRGRGFEHSARARADGSARLVLRRPKRLSVALAIRADRPGDTRAVPATLVVRVPLGP